jgi:CRISPR-associated Csx3 family protein
MQRVRIDIEAIYGKIAKLDKVNEYVDEARTRAGQGNEVVLTGRGPVWLYLLVAHALHGNAKRLIYESPATGPVVIFDHDPFSKP